MIENKELRKGIEDKNMLLATVTHDLRAPLGSITMTLKQLEEETQGNLSTTLRDMMKSSLSSCDLLNFLINDILDASKLFESGELKLNLEPCKLDDVFGQVFKIMESKFLQKEVRFETFVTDDVPETLITDSRRLIQLILNFITNANKFTIKGRVLLMGKRNRSDPNLIQISILDTGIGVKDEDQHKIMQKFYTAGGERNKNGVGLGLTICQNLIGLLGPTKEINFSSKYQQGSKFWFDIYSNMNIQQTGLGKYDRAPIKDDLEISSYSKSSELIENLPVRSIPSFEEYDNYMLNKSMEINDSQVFEHLEKMGRLGASEDRLEDDEGELNSEEENLQSRSKALVRIPSKSEF